MSSLLSWLDFGPIISVVSVQKRCQEEEDLEDNKTEEVQKVWFCLVNLPINK